MWQDYVFLVGGIIADIALVPMIFHKNKPPLMTSIPTFVIIIAYCFCYATLNLRFATIIAAITGLIWGILAIQRIRNK
jgi:hypothetical protein